MWLAPRPKASHARKTSFPISVLKKMVLKYRDSLEVQQRPIRERQWRHWLRDEKKQQRRFRRRRRRRRHLLGRTLIVKYPSEFTLGYFKKIAQIFLQQWFELILYRETERSSRKKACTIHCSCISGVNCCMTRERTWLVLKLASFYLVNTNLNRA